MPIKIPNDLPAVQTARVGTPHISHTDNTKFYFFHYFFAFISLFSIIYNLLTFFLSSRATSLLFS